MSIDKNETAMEAVLQKYDDAVRDIPLADAIEVCEGLIEELQVCLEALRCDARKSDAD